MTVRRCVVHVHERQYYKCLLHQKLLLVFLGRTDGCNIYFIHQCCNFGKHLVHTQVPVSELQEPKLAVDQMLYGQWAINY